MAVLSDNDSINLITWDSDTVEESVEANKITRFFDTK